MDTAVIRRLVLGLLGILCAYVIADYLSRTLVMVTGLTGPAQFISGFVAFAVLFFTILYGLQKLLNISFFEFTRM